MAVTKPSSACHIRDSMTGAPPVLDRPALRAALSDMPIEPPEAGTRFELALALKLGWNVGFSERVTREYRRFLYLAATAGFEVTPSQYVDEAWHLHLASPHYRDVLCNRILGRPLEHRPGDGTPEDDARCARQYEETLALYERVFKEPAPSEIWPRPVAPEELEEGWWTFNGRAIGQGIALLSFFAGIWAYFLGGEDFGTALVMAGILLGAISFQDRRRRRNGADWGADCGGGSDSGSSCGSSCGGGCGGD